MAISTDDEAGLAKSIENYKSGAFPFPLASDAAMEVFKACRAFDDFENRPLHAMLFIDGAGLVRWQDISFEPFRDARFILNEARRLLSFAGAKSPLAGRGHTSAAISGAADPRATETSP